MSDRPSNATADRLDAPATLVIDLDGTLVDTVADLTRALNQLLAAQDLVRLPENTVRKLVGRGVGRLVEWGLEAAGGRPDGRHLPELVQAFKDIYGRDPASRSRPYDGVIETLDRWRAEGHTMAMCTNKPQAPSDLILRDLALAPYFAAVAGGDRFAVRKPEAGHLTGTIELAGGDPARCVMIGDSITDLDAARAAGIPIVLVDYGYTAQPAATLGADATVSSFTEIPALLPGLVDGRGSKG
ncbi:phosphoglycolate phosphatase [Rhodovibrio sodomensis]|uniref:Phosphoglycolate phosphatase n=1 Tax=Rhodovibrio sodomensis TaxID=1088 RepID=A0ABS1DKU3_9PROT|nr:HAD-IA family hydrolase [Rhodovibrio sodomensis]MBK1670844.1 phosphoglycolate phosphatase [Rhodovibrio sodomensis]